MTTEETKFQPKDYKSDQYVRWCPGCGDHAVLNCLHKAMAEVGVAPHNMAVISGIGCSSRLPYYMNTYGFHTIHGRGAAIATGVKTARPDLSVWLITGDGDCLAIGGNHFIHAVRRNIDLNIVLFNNKIYGLTKGQYSPTSDRGFVSKSSPYGTVEDPFIPAELALGARGNFFARTIDVDLKNTTEVLTASARHKGASVTEVLVNCVIFNDGIHKGIVDKAYRACCKCCQYHRPLRPAGQKRKSRHNRYRAPDPDAHGGSVPSETDRLTFVSVRQRLATSPAC